MKLGLSDLIPGRINSKRAWNGLGIRIHGFSAPPICLHERQQCVVASQVCLNSRDNRTDSFERPLPYVQLMLFLSMSTVIPRGGRRVNMHTRILKYLGWVGP